MTKYRITGSGQRRLTGDGDVRTADAPGTFGSEITGSAVGVGLAASASPSATSTTVASAQLTLNSNAVVSAVASAAAATLLAAALASFSPTAMAGTNAAASLSMATGSASPTATAQAPSDTTLVLTGDALPSAIAQALAGNADLVIAANGSLTGSTELAGTTDFGKEAVPHPTFDGGYTTNGTKQIPTGWIEYWAERVTAAAVLPNSFTFSASTHLGGISLGEIFTPGETVRFKIRARKTAQPAGNASLQFHDNVWHVVVPSSTPIGQWVEIEVDSVVGGTGLIISNFSAPASWEVSFASVRKVTPFRLLTQAGINATAAADAPSTMVFAVDGSPSYKGGMSTNLAMSTVASPIGYASAPGDSTTVLETAASPIGYAYSVGEAPLVFPSAAAQPSGTGELTGSLDHIILLDAEPTAVAESNLATSLALDLAGEPGGNAHSTGTTSLAIDVAGSPIQMVPIEAAPISLSIAAAGSVYGDSAITGAAPIALDTQAEPSATAAAELTAPLVFSVDAAPSAWSGGYGTLPLNFSVSGAPTMLVHTEVSTQLAMAISAQLTGLRYTAGAAPIGINVSGIIGINKAAKFRNFWQEVYRTRQIVLNAIDATNRTLAKDAGLAAEANALALVTTNTRIDDTNDALAVESQRVTELSGSINILPRVFIQPDMPTGGSYNTGDMWVESDNSNSISFWNGAGWVASSDLSGAVVYAQPTAPAAGGLNLGDVWFDTDDNNRMHRWNGGAWVDVSDLRIEAQGSLIEQQRIRIEAAEGTLSLHGESLEQINLDLAGKASTTVTAGLQTQIDETDDKLVLQGQSIDQLTLNVQSAQGAADAAQEAADDAAEAAALANTAVENISSDGVLSRVEKSNAILAGDRINNELTDIRSKADSFGVSRVNFDAAYAALSNYLASLVPAWNDTTQNTAIDGPTYRLKWNDYYLQQTLLLNAIAAKAKELADAADTKAGAAKDAADTAQQAADDAAQDAALANTAIDKISSDGVLSRGEKSAAILAWATVTDELADIQAKASTFGVSKVAYENAYNTLAAYLANLVPAWNDTTQDTTIVAATYRANWSAYYRERTLLLNAIALKAKELADDAKSTASAAVEATNQLTGRVEQTEQGIQVNANAITSVSGRIGEEPDNLVRKATFTSDMAIGSWDNGSVWATAVHASENYVLRTTTGGYETITHPVTPGDKYDISIDLYTSELVTPGVLVGLHTVTKDGVNQFDAQISDGTQTGFHTLTGRVTIPAGARIGRPFLFITGSGTLYWTKLRIVRVSGADLQAASATEQLSVDLNSVTQMFNASWGVTLDVNGLVSGVKSVNDGTRAEFGVLADVFKVVNPDGGAAMTWEDGTLWNKGSSHSVIIGQSFGSSGDLLIWAGMNPASVAAASKSNGVFWIDNTGNSYFGGSLRAGALTNEAVGTTTTDTAEVIIGPFGTYGHNKLIKFGYVYTQLGHVDGDQVSTYNGQPWSASGVIERAIGENGAYVQVGTWSATGSRAAEYDSEFTSTRITTTANGTGSLTDMDTSTEDFRYRMRITSRSPVLALYSQPTTLGTATHSPTQRLSLGSYED